MAYSENYSTLTAETFIRIMLETETMEDAFKVALCILSAVGKATQLSCKGTVTDAINAGPNINEVLACLPVEKRVGMLKNLGDIITLITQRIAKNEGISEAEVGQKAEALVRAMRTEPSGSKH